MNARLILYSRPRCPECDLVREELEQAAVEFEEMDVSGDPSLESEYGMFVPVIEADGRIIFHTGMDPKELVTETIPNL